MNPFDFTAFSEMLIHLFRTSSLFPDTGMYVEILINPASGVFQDQGFRKKALALMSEYRVKNTEGKDRNDIEVQCTLTKNRSSAAADAVFAARRLTEKTGRKNLLVTAGGDGFHKDTGMAVMQKDPSLFNDIILFRLPLGTGNDTSDASDIHEIFQILSGAGKIRKGSCLVFSARNLPLDYAFNVISFGLDAYVCALTELWKRKIRGDIYKVMVDVSTLLYDFRYKTYPMYIKLDDKNTGPVEFTDKLVLTVIGTRGGTTYGGKKKILPGSENFLTVHILSLFQKIRLKSLFLTGRHTGLPGVRLFETDRITIEYPGEILVELDGEVTALKPENFPVVIERKPDSLNILSL